MLTRMRADELEIVSECGFATNIEAKRGWAYDYFIILVYGVGNMAGFQRKDTVDIAAGRQNMFLDIATSEPFKHKYIITLI